MDYHQEERDARLDRALRRADLAVRAAAAAHADLLDLGEKQAARAALRAAESCSHTASNLELLIADAPVAPALLEAIAYD